jgi:hypothetical protein
MIRAVFCIAPLLLVIIVGLAQVQPAGAAHCLDPGTPGAFCSERTAGEPAQFEPPIPPANSLLATATYAYILDNVNVYAEPSHRATRLYNVGEGFLYATIHGRVESEGQAWYILNPGQYVRVEDIRLVPTPEFHGVQVTSQPKRPFGWILQEVQPSSEPDGEPDPGAGRLTRYTFFQVYDAVVGLDNWIWYNIGGGRWVRQTYVSVVDVNEPPPEVGSNEFWVEVDLYEQSFAAYEGGRMIYAGLISSGLNRWPTYEGLFQVWSRYLQNPMSGAEGQIDYYAIEDVPYIMYFDRRNEIALHGAFWHDRFGYKHSHGCVNMPPRDAEWVFNWSAHAPNDLWVWVHTSDPMSYFLKYGR